ncbi:unnamed protein product, partial [Polarella glacialis]
VGIPAQTTKKRFALRHLQWHLAFLPSTMGANKVVQKSKEAKMKAAMAGGKGKKKKWSKGKVKEKLANLVMFDKATYDKMLKEIPKAKLITPSVVSERLKVNGSVARVAIRHLEEKGLIQSVCEKSSKQMIYTRKIGTED